MRQYRISTKAPQDTEETVLEPGVHGALYNIPEIRDSVAFLENQPNIGFIGITISTRLYGITVIDADELKPNHFQLTDLS